MVKREAEEDVLKLSGDLGRMNEERMIKRVHMLDIQEIKTLSEKWADE